MRALHIHAGPLALAHIREHGLKPEHIGVVPAAAGGPKGLILGPLDRFLFGQWLPQSRQRVHLVGASIGAWRMATACLQEPVAALHDLERDYIHQHYALQAGQKRVCAEQVSREFGLKLQAFFGARVAEVLTHPRYCLHVLASRGRHVLGREHVLATPLGYFGAYLSNAVSRPALGAWLERVVFSSQAEVPFGVQDFRTRLHRLTEANFMPAVQASCSIPFVLQAVHDIPGAAPGAYWDGGITDYHLHLDWHTPGDRPEGRIVLYPHFQQQVVPGWLDKALKWRHASSRFLDHTVVLAPNPEWVKTLPNGKLPDRKDFSTYGQDLQARVQVWSAATGAAQQLADEFAQWLEHGRADAVMPL
ncbi:MAG: patatin-like phospholipase family protein [Betaproteobacteria bacterium]|nr:patatin-like phospholipase family protein [Betaproteobacteria bacterium]